MKTKSITGIILLLLLASVLTVAFNVAPTAASESGLVGYWKFDEGSGTVASDSSGNGNTGTLMNGPLWVDGKFGKALYFDGVDDYIRVPHSSSLNIAGNLTIALWINPQMASLALTGADPGLALVSKRTTNSPQPYLLRIFPGGGIGFNAHYTGVGDWREHNTWPSTPVVVNQQQHVAVSRTLVGSAVNISIYYNGVLQTSATNNWGPATTNTQDLWLVRDPYYAAFTNEGTFKGWVDEVKIYNYSRTQEQIIEDMNLAVGGIYIPVDRLSLLAPYIALVSTIILAVSISVAYIRYIKKQ